MSFAIELEGASLVLIGSLNPSIFHPAWFLSQQLIGQPDYETAQVELITRELSVLTIAGMRIIVQPERFQIETTAMDMLGPARDLALGAFKILEHTPVKSMGINHHAHFKMPSEEAWHTVGHRLAPKELWQGLIENPGTRAVQMLGKRSNSPAKYLKVQIEPSQKVQQSVYVGTNEHFAADTLQQHLDWLVTEWEPAQQFARELGSKILEKCLDGSG